jgi:hypothetical protein
MWLATKLGARKAPKERPLPDLGIVQNELGSTKDAVRYRRLFQEHPSIELGPDETIDHHYSRLKSAEADRLGRDTTDVDRRARDREMGKLKTPAPVGEVTDARSWATGPARVENAPSDLKGMPQRIPGWFTGDAMDAGPPGYGVPPMSRRDPMATRRPPISPSAVPPLPTHDEWVRGLADKGIYLNPDGSRMTPEQLALPQRPLRGHQIWEQFTRPAGQHRAAMVVVAYVRRVLTEDDAIAQFWRRHNAMLGNGWEHHESGSGNWYEKKIGDKTHRIMNDTMGDQQGWTHHVTGETPKFYDDLHDALLHASTGQMQASLVQKPTTIEDSSHHPDRAQPTRAMNRLVPPKTKGKFQTLNSTWSDEG